jgi:type 1 glutamine amidotransferase
MTTKKALMVYGGWDGHQPKQCSERFRPHLEKNGFTVVVQESLDCYSDRALMSSLDLIVQCWTCGTITGEQSQGLQAAVSAGVGLAGWHGGLGDSFRGDVGYQWMTGGQFVGHPGNAIDYTVHIQGWDDPITAGVRDFTMPKTEQYYMLVDPSNLVLATSTFSGQHQDHTAGVVMPVVWKRRWGKGKVFYSSIGHTPQDFDVPEARIITERGLLWAAR